METQPIIWYLGSRKEGGVEVMRCEYPVGQDTATLLAAQIAPLPLRLDLANHSPTGFEWGYGGSGPAQLALALLADAVGDDLARRVYQTFKWKVVASLPNQAWLLNRQVVEQTAHRLLAYVEAKTEAAPTAPTASSPPPIL